MRISEYLKEYYPCWKKNKGDYKYNHVVTKVTDSSLKVIKGAVFGFITSFNNKSFKYLIDAVNKGAKSIFISDKFKNNQEIKNIINNQKINVFFVTDPKIDISRLIKLVYLKKYETFPCLIGVTGTAGKTSVTTIIYESLKRLHYDCLLIGSSGNFAYYANHEEFFDTKNTTPTLCTIYELMSAHDLSYDYVVMEVSSQGIAEGRVLGLPFDYSIITCFASEHLEYHHSIAEYKNAKARLLQATTKATIINSQMSQFSFFNSISDVKKVTYGINHGDYRTSILSKNATGSVFLICDCENKHLVNSSLIAEFNIENLLASYALLKELNIKPDKIISIFNTLKPVSGRMNQYKIANRQVIIDYAHTLSAIEAVLKHLCTYKNGKLITVIGCGGDRDQSRRPYVGNYATMYSDIVIFTEDNSRSEKLSDIIKDIISGCEKGNYIVEENRYKAIHKAFEISAPKDTIAILGKGNEKEIIKDVRIKYSDEEVIKEIIDEYSGELL